MTCGRDGLIATVTFLLVVVLIIGQGLAAPARAITAAEAESSNREFAGFSFGVGFSLTLDTGTNRRVDDAAIDANGIVRVNKSNNTPARVILESHYFFPMEKLRNTTDLLTRGWGPFLALQPGDKEVVNAIGFGIMFGFRRSGDSSAQSFNIGIGYVVDPSAKILGEEFVENKPAPTGPGGGPLPLRFETRDQGGVLGLVSFAW